MHPAIPYIQERRQAFVEELKAFVRIPSVSTKSEHKGDVQKASRPHAVRQTGSLNRFAISFSYLPAGKVRDVDINFSVDLSLA